VAEKKETLEDRIGGLEGMLKKLKYEYMKRNITEKEYQERYEETRKKLKMLKIEAQKKKY